MANEILDSGTDLLSVEIGGGGASNILVVQYGDATHALSELSQYDTVLMQMNDKTFYLTELTDTTAHFMSCYRIDDKDNIETCDYDGAAWTEVSAIDMDSNRVDYMSTGSAPRTVTGAFTALNSDSATTGHTAFLQDSAGGIIGYLIPRLGEYGTVLMSSGTAAYWGTRPNQGKVSVDSTSNPGYLDDVLVSDSDLVSLVNADGKLHVQVNTAVSYDPKIQTLDEFAINTATSNYGGYALASGYSKLEWQNPSSYSNLNAIVFQSMRIATSQGVITKCNLALTGNLSGDAPCFNVALFSTDGVLLGSTGLVFPKETGASDAGNQLLTIDMTSAFDDALNLKRNTRYIIQAWSCGCQLAAYSHGTTYNNSYDYTLRQNMQTSTSTTDWVSVDNAGFSRAETVPYISFGASEIA